MRQSVRDAFKAFTDRFEGADPWMYCDVKGFVTIGYGDLIEHDGLPAIPRVLVFVDKLGKAVDWGRVLSEWYSIKSLQALKLLGGGAYQSHANLRATAASLEALLRQGLEEDWRELLGYFPEAEEWPARAQLGVLSMAWACGAGFPDPRNPVGYPKFSAAARRRDWLTCAAECHIEDSQNHGVTPRNAANKALFLAAAAGGDPDDLST